MARPPEIMQFHAGADRFGTVLIWTEGTEPSSPRAMPAPLVQTASKASPGNYSPRPRRNAWSRSDIHFFVLFFVPPRKKHLAFPLSA